MLLLRSEELSWGEQDGQNGRCSHPTRPRRVETRLSPCKAAGSSNAEAYAEGCSKRPSNAAAGETKPEA